MATDYEKQLEEEIFSLKNLLDERTKELDAAKAKLESFIVNSTTNILGGISYDDNGGGFCNFTINAPVVSIGKEKITENDIGNLHHLWCLHIQRENNPPLLYRIWRKIVSCLTTKKN